MLTFLTLRHLLTHYLIRARCAVFLGQCFDGLIQVQLLVVLSAGL